MHILPPYRAIESREIFNVKAQFKKRKVKLLLRCLTPSIILGALVLKKLGPSLSWIRYTCIHVPNVPSFLIILGCLTFNSEHGWKFLWSSKHGLAGQGSQNLPSRSCELLLRFETLLFFTFFPLLMETNNFLARPLFPLTLSANWFG